MRSQETGLGGQFARKRTKTKGIEQTSDESLCTTIHFHIQYILLTRLNLVVAIAVFLAQEFLQVISSILNELKLSGCCCFVTASFLQTHHLSVT